MTGTPFTNRISERLHCDITVQACDTLSNHDARIVDLSLHGAQVNCPKPWPQGSTIHLDVDGEFVWAKVMWSEIDRMGLRFLAPLTPASALGTYLAGRRRAPVRSAAARVTATFGRRSIAA